MTAQTFRVLFNNRTMLKSISLAGVVLTLLLASCSPVALSTPTGGSSTGAPVPSVVQSTRTPDQATSVATSTPHKKSNSSKSSTKSTDQPSGTSSIPNSAVTTPSATSGAVKTIFLIVMENHNWSDIYNSPSAPYINNTLLPQASYATQYYNPQGNHPSEPNYIWLEAGTALGITNDNTPASNHQSTTEHLVTLLDKAGFTWKSYQEGITGTSCPLKGKGLYAPKHNPMVYFDNVTATNDPTSAYCIAHVRPYTELQTDLQNNTVAQYNFITPNLCNDMHNSNGCQTPDEIKNGDTWLSQQIPGIMASDAYKNGGVIFITWDESEKGDHPIGMIVLSPLAKGGGYSSSIRYTHSSTLRTIEEIFNISPLLGDSAKATDLKDLFKQFP